MKDTAIGCLVWIVLGAVVLGGIWGCRALTSDDDGAAVTSTTVPATTSTSTTTTTLWVPPTVRYLPPITLPPSYEQQPSYEGDRWRCNDCGNKWTEDYDRATEDWYEYGQEYDDEYSEDGEVPDWWYEDWVPTCPECGSDNVEILG